MLEPLSKFRLPAPVFVKSVPASVIPLMTPEIVLATLRDEFVRNNDPALESDKSVAVNTPVVTVTLPSG